MSYAINSLADAVRFYEIALRAENKSEQTIKNYMNSLAGMSAWLAMRGRTSLADITPGIMREYIAHVTERTDSAYSAINAGRIASGFFNFLVADDIMAENPMQKVKLPGKPKRKPHIIPNEKIEDFVNAAKDERDRALMMFLLDTGLRRGECVALDISDVDLSSGRVNVRRGKGGKSRTVMMGTKTRRAMARYLVVRHEVVGRDANALWTTQHRRRIDPGTVTHIANDCGNAIGIKADAHTLRRTFATQCIRNGMNLYVLKELMGHSDIRTLEYYASLVFDDVEQAYMKMSPMDNM